MIKIRVLDILKKQQHTKYWLFIRMGMSYRNFDRLVSNETTGIRYKNIEKLCYYLNCTPGDLFEFSPDKTDHLKA